MTQHASSQRIVTALRENAPFTPKFIELFSDLTPGEVSDILQTWPQLPVERRRSLMQHLVKRMDDDYVMSFDAFARAVLEDEDAQVRTLAIRLLWDNGDPRLAPVLISILQNDDSGETRAEAASVLGSYVYIGELEELDEELKHNIEDALLSAAQGDASPLAQRKAIEALGYSSRPEVPALLEAAYRHADPQWVSSALFAMGRSSDPRWEETVLRALVHEMQQVRLAAVEAAGELELSSARSILLNALEEEEDEDLLRAEIWSLSQIGGEDVRTYLDNLIDSVENDDLVDFIEEALENLTFTEGKLDMDFGLMNYDADEIPEDDDK